MAPVEFATGALWAVPACSVVDTTAASPDTIRVLNVRAPAPDAAMPVCPKQRLTFVDAPVAYALQVPTGADLRDVIEVGVGVSRLRPGVVVTTSTEVVEFARKRGGYSVEALPWQWTYVLVTAEARAIARFSSPTERDALAREAVRAPARGAVEPFPGRGNADCTAPALTARVEPSRAIAYVEGDGISRSLAERLVVIAGLERVVAVGADSVDGALRSGRAAAAVFPIPRDPRTGCAVPEGLRVPATAVPLVDVHAHVIVRRGSGAAFVIAPDGSLHFARRASR